MASTESSGENAAKTYTIEASVPTGFESVAAEEAKEMFGTECRTIRGKITFETSADRVKDILKLGGIDHCRVRVLHLRHFSFTDDGDDCLSRLQLLVKQCDWAEGLEVWRQFYTFAHPIPHTPPSIPTDEEIIDVCHSIHMPGHGGSPHKVKRKGRKDKRKGGGKRERGGERDRRQQEGEGTEEREAVGNGAVEDATAEVEENGKPEDPTSADHSGTVKGQGPAEANGTREEDPDTSAQSPEKKSRNTGDGGEEEGAGATTSGHTNNKAWEGQTETLSAENHHVSSTGDRGNTQATPSVGEGMELSTDLQNHRNNAAGDSAGVRSAEDSQSQNGPAQNANSNGGEAPGTPDDGQAEASVQGGPVKKVKGPVDPSKPVFRVTCKRTGENHSFDSMSAAASFGSAVQTYFGWSVDMTRFNIEVMLTIDNGEVSVGLTLTPESLHRRNLVAFGVTTLRPTICHNMLRMVKIRPGHVVCDPLCGTASISIQGALSFPAFQLCGDNHTVAMEKTHSNHTALNAKRHKADKGALMMDGVQWNACHLPLRDGVVDVFVSDLPFGKRVGRKFDNWRLYCNVLDEMARCSKLTARAALLTGDINNMVKAIQNQRYWTRRRCYSCNIGGIAAAVFLLCRSSVPYTPRPHSHPQSYHERYHQPNHSNPNNLPPSSTHEPPSVDPSGSSEQTDSRPSPMSSDRREQPPPPLQSIPSSSDSEQNVGSQTNGGGKSSHGAQD